MAVSLERSSIIPFLRNPHPVLSRTVSDTSNEFWAKNGGEFQSVDAWREARKRFRSQSGNIPIILRGGGRGTMFTAGHLLKAIPNAHLLIYEDDAVLGGMALRAISSFIPGHIPAKEAALRDGMKLLMNPRVDIIPKTKLSDERFRELILNYGLPVAVDASGTRPVRGQDPYGDRVWDIMDLVTNINGPFDEDGHMKRAHIPLAFAKDGKRLPLVSVIGGNTGRDAQIAFGLIETAQDVARVYGVDIEEVDTAKILEHGITRTRRELGLLPIEDLYLYRRSIGEMSGVKKLFNRTAKLERGSPELAQILEEGILGKDGWQEKEGGRFLGNAELTEIVEGNGNIQASIRHDSPEFTKPVDVSLALVSIGFEKGKPFRVETPKGIVGTDVGIKVNGGGDLPSTAKSASAVAPDLVNAVISHDHSYPKKLYGEFLSEISREQRRTGIRGDDDVEQDPVAFTLSRGPRHLIDRAFIGFVPDEGK